MEPLDPPNPSAPASSTPRGPRPQRRRRWPWVVAALLGASSLAGGVAFWTAPRWLGPALQERILRKISQRLGVAVTAEGVEADLRAATIRGLRVADLARLERLEVEFDPWDLLRGRPPLRRLSGHGGYVRGSLDEVRRLAERVRAGIRAGRERGEGAGRLREATLGGVAVDLVAPGQVRVRGEARARWVPGDPVHAELEDVAVTLPGTPELDAARVELDLRPAEPFPLSVEIAGGGVQVGPSLALAGARGTVVLADASFSSVTIDLAGTFADRVEPALDETLWTLRGEIDRDGHGAVTAKVASFELGRAPRLLAALPLVDSETATVAGDVRVDFGPEAWDVAGTLKLAGLNVRHDLLARTVVRNVGLDVKLDARWEPPRERLSLRELEVARGGVVAHLSGAVEHPRDRARRKVSLTLRVPPVPCNDVLAAIPAELVPALRGFELGGTFEAEVELEVDMAHLDALTLRGKVGIDGCQVLRAPALASAARLRAPFTHRVQMRDGGQRLIRLFPGSGGFTSMDAISPYMVAAVLTTEDGGFYRHRGFLPSQFAEALRRNLAAGRVRLGASTITMQMVKNVLLSHERTVARKLQEMFLTWYVERILDKRRIMELYLNVVEFGPGIYGITQAAAHYFGKQPGDLNPLEAADLALMLPSPVRRHAYHCRGKLTPAFDAKLRRILGLMYRRGRLTVEEYDTWKDAELVFAPETEPEGACLARIDHLLAARRGQQAASGLLAPRGGAGAAEAPAPWPSLSSPRAGASAADGPAAPDPAEADAPGHPAMDDPAGGAERP